MRSPSHTPAGRARALARPSAGAAALVTSVAATAAFALLARTVARRPTTLADLKLRRFVRGSRGARSRRAAAALYPIGKWWAYGPASLAGAAYVASRRGARAAVPLPGAALTAALLGRAFDRWLGRRLAPPGRRSLVHPVFPSGHALGTSAVALAGAWVAARSGLARPRVALPAAALLPLTSGVGRLHEDKHWVSDVVGGWLAGLAVAAAWAAVDELGRPRSEV